MSQPEPDPDLLDVPRQLIITAFAALVARVSKSKAKDTALLPSSTGVEPTKNFKKFTKVIIMKVFVVRCAGVRCAWWFSPIFYIEPHLPGNFSQTIHAYVRASGKA